MNSENIQNKVWVLIFIFWNNQDWFDISELLSSHCSNVAKVFRTFNIIYSNQNQQVGFIKSHLSKYFQKHGKILIKELVSECNECY